MRIAPALFCAIAFGGACSFCVAQAADTPGDESGVGGLRLRSLRSAEELRLDLHRAGHTPDAILRLEPLQQHARDQFLIADGVSSTGGEIVEQWLKSAPTELWQRWNESIRPNAERDWQQWKSTRKETGLREFLKSYGSSSLGVTAWKAQARREMDEARWDHAAVSLQRLLSHRAATPSDRAQAVLELITVRVRQQRPGEARRLAQQHAPLLIGQTVRWSGMAQPAAEVLHNLLPPADDAAPPISSRPSLDAFWTNPLILPKELQTYWPDWRQSYRAEGAWLNPVAEPLIVGNKVIVPTMTGMIAHDAASSKLNWQIQHEDWQRVLPKLEKGDSFENRDWRSHILDQLVRRESADSILGRISSDGKRIFAVSSAVGSEMDRLVPRTGTNAAPRDDGTLIPVENRLSAYDVQTGDPLWRIGGASAGPTYKFAQMFFCGPPCVADETLYIVGQQETELRLIAIDAARGEESWSTVLGDVPRSLSADPMRQRTACPVIWNEGTLVVTTANGAVIAVDATTHAPRWAYRYPTALRESIARPRGENTTFLPDPWWDTWRDARVFVTNAAILFVSPESQRLHAIDRTTGVPLWTVPREEALWFTGVTEQTAIVASANFIAAYDLATGQPSWRTPFSESGGRPCLTGSEIIQPLSNGDIARIHATDGKLTLQRGVKNLVAGNFITDGKAWYSVNADSIARWRDPDEAAAALKSLLQQDPASVALKTLDAQLRLEAGDRKGARERLPMVPNPTEALSETARQITLADLAEDPSSWRAAVEKFPPGPFTDERFEVAEAIIAAARKAGDLVDAGRLILQWFPEATQNETVTAAGTRRRVRVDLACLGLWDDIWQPADASQKAALARLLEEKWQQAAQGTDPFAVAWLLEAWQPLPIARQKAMDADDQHFLGRSLAASELQLLALAETAPASEASRLWQRLADVLSDAGFTRIAAAYQAHALMTDPADQTAIGPGRDYADASRPRWPTNSPQIDSQKERNTDVYQIMVPLDLDASPWFEGLDVSIDRQYRRLVFTSAEHRGTWELRLPNSNGPMRMFPNALMGWGRGRLLILRVGSELFAITPFDDRGEPVARILWMMDTLVGPLVLAEHGRLDPVSMVPGVREEDARAVNAFGRPLGQVGPICAGYVCYQEGGKLVSLDTLTGRKRWERFDLPFDARCFGDEERVLVWSPRSRQVEVLRAMDGQQLEQREWTAHPDRVILLHGTWAYRIVPQANGWQLLCEDVARGREVWTHQAPAGSSPVVLDCDTMGLVDPAGKLHMLNLRTGAAVAAPISFPPMPQFERAIVTRDAETWFVVLSNRVSRQAALQSPNQRNSHRAPPVDGPMIAIDRRTYQSRWRSPLARIPWPLDQSRSAPLLVYSYKLGTPDQIANGATSGTLRILDKRTGADVVVREGQSTLGYATLQSDPNRGLIEVRLENETLRLRYHPHPPAPSSPEP